jgi:ectoine hydroxylase-related dioxygenase (phytanoyl-CoA dioxygenase family)
VTAGLAPLTRADLDHYETRGWWVSPWPVLSEAELAAARAAVERLHREGVPADAPTTAKAHLDWRPGGAGRDTVLRANNYAAFLHPALRALACHPGVGALAAALSGSPGIRLFNSTLVYKPAELPDQANAVGWHTDKAYWAGCTSSRMLTAWIPLHDVTADGSPLTVLDRSHTWPDAEVSDLRQVRGFAAAERYAMEDALRRRAVPFEPVALTMPAGHLSFHHCLTFHGSPPNTSARPRVSLTVHLQDAANEWRPALEPDGSRVRYQHDDKVRRTAAGEPDYADPELCPVVWPGAG